MFYERSKYIMKKVVLGLGIIGIAIVAFYLMVIVTAWI